MEESNQKKVVAEIDLKLFEGNDSYMAINANGEQMLMMFVALLLKDPFFENVMIQAIKQAAVIVSKQGPDVLKEHSKEVNLKNGKAN